MVIRCRERERERAMCMYMRNGVYGCVLGAVRVGKGQTIYSELGRSVLGNSYSVYIVAE